MKIFKSEQQIIAEIHHAFDSAEDRLLEEAKKILSKPIDGIIEDIEIANRLKTVGFTQSAIVQRVERELSNREGKNVILVENKEQAELINYYKSSYPFMKFLTVNELDRICDKYNLLHAPISNYIGDVPEKNLRDIETSQPLRNIDFIEDSYKLIFGNWGSEKSKDLISALGIKNFTITVQQRNIIMDRHAGAFIHGMLEYYKNKDLGENTWLFIIYQKYYGGMSGCPWNYSEIEKISREGLFIAAPSTHFNLKGLTRKGKHFFQVFRTKVKDPIVFRYVRGGIQVITKWGLEASDADLRNEIDN